MSNSTDEFAELAERSQHSLLSYIFAFVHNLHDAEDIYQQTLAILWKKFDTFDRASDFGTWARGVARFEVANFLKKKRNSRVYFSETLISEIDQAVSEPDASGQSGFLAALRRCMKKLSRVDRELVQDFYGGASAKVIAEANNRSVEGVYNALSRIRRSLSECIRSVVAEEDRE